MNSHFTSDFFKGNRKQLRKAFGKTAPIVITANGLIQSSADSAFPFRQDSSFWYLTGIDEPDIVLVMDGDNEYLIVPQREEVRQIFDGALNHEALSKQSGISEVFDAKTGWKKLEKRLKKAKGVATLSPAGHYVEQYGFYANPARQTLGERIISAHPGIKILDLKPHMARLRAVKQPIEIDALQQAIDLTTTVMHDVKKRFSTYSYEYEIEADITATFRREGSDGHAFSPIVASGARACTLHNVANNGQLEKGGVTVIDIGASVNHYAADITRTYTKAPPTKRQSAVFDAVVQVQQFAFEILKPGISLKTYESQVHGHMAEKLRQLRLIKQGTNEEVRQYFPHATSHFLGLDVHDVGNYDEPLAEGMVLTVEPGIYIRDEGIGVRIEDDVLITEKGIKVLSRNLPRVLQ